MGVVAATVSNAGYKGETITNPSGTEKGTKYLISDASKKGGAKGDLTVRAMKGGQCMAKERLLRILLEEMLGEMDRHFLTMHQKVLGIIHKINYLR